MKNWILLVSFVFVMSGCTLSVNDQGKKTSEPAQNTAALQPASENDPIVINDSGSGSSNQTLKPLWTELTHRTLTSIAASQWGLSSARTALLSDASDDPDTYESGIENGYQQQWYHAYIYDDTFGSIYYLWGGADVRFQGNIDGPLNGYGYQGYYAGYYYGLNQSSGDRYLGYALHYIEDVNITLHSTAPDSLGITVPYYTVDMLTHHFDFETWVQNNLTSGWNLLQSVQNDYYYYPITDLKASLKSAAWNSCSYKGTSSVGYSAWKAYRDCGYPTAAGSGNSTLADNTKSMLIAAGRYAKGAIKYTLDKYGQWTSLY